VKTEKSLKRTNIYLTQEQLEKLNVLSVETGISMTEMVRRSIDEYLYKAETMKEFCNICKKTHTRFRPASLCMKEGNK
jgi:predicted DNA-binding protein